MANVWTMKAWAAAPKMKTRRGGVRLRFDPGVDPEVRRAVMAFVRWLRAGYVFPVRVPIYVKKSPYIRAMDGDTVSATFFEPYIRVSTGTYAEDVGRYGREFALQRIQISVAHELTYYFQWINRVQISDRGRERQAASDACRLVRMFWETENDFL